MMLTMYGLQNVRAGAVKSTENTATPQIYP